MCNPSPLPFPSPALGPGLTPLMPNLHPPPLFSFMYSFIHSLNKYLSSTICMSPVLFQIDPPWGPAALDHHHPPNASPSGLQLSVFAVPLAQWQVSAPLGSPPSPSWSQLSVWMARAHGAVPCFDVWTPHLRGRESESLSTAASSKEMSASGM